MSQLMFANNPPLLQDYSHSRVIVKSEATPVGTVIGSIKATDSDGPKPIIFSITDESTRELVRLSAPSGDSATGRSVNIILNKTLDRDRVSITLDSSDYSTATGDSATGCSVDIILNKTLDRDRM
ncbi:hypothetical protein KUTeg_004411 [Tegillarca granosa]|uniref:Cadherin domain-containing protein n=1 Tax=Tegillarca granosa TaxID=220873 RepID=A0ABQ9FUD5_TEGGR|nr:hypothetical protein KUTeg_004411 [Tegillarca granosa]